MRNPTIITNAFYHVFNRGVDQMRLFRDTTDYLRFYKSLFLFNDANYHQTGGTEFQRDIDLLVRERFVFEQDPLVRILAFVMLPNHFHLLIQQIKEEGAATFFHKLGKGYARYHNMKYGRTGPLFSGPYKAVLIKEDSQLIHVPRYIHLNALDLFDQRWRSGKIDDWESAFDHLNSYPWSSHGVYLGNSQLLPVVNEKAANELFSGPKDYEEFLRTWTGRYVLNNAKITIP